MNISRAYLVYIFSDQRIGAAGRVPRNSAFEVMFRVGEMSELLTLGAQKVLAICSENS